MPESLGCIVVCVFPATPPVHSWEVGPFPGGLFEVFK